MASVSSKTSTNLICHACDNQSFAVLTCNGCSKTFCLKHSVEHRHELSNYFNRLTAQEKFIQKAIKQQQDERRQHPLLKAIDRWEEISIVKIRKAASNARAQVLHYNTMKITEIEMQLHRINAQMNISRQRDDYIEMNLIEWKNKLETLKNSLTTPPPSIKVRENRSIPLVLMIDVNTYCRTTQVGVTERFDRAIGDIHITENGSVATHGNIHVPNFDYKWA
ncbi:unnamed protein product [Rotaria sp. Silwood1]|nr:unnamed protein product [Rotaria sp. Silwood1]